MDKIEKYINDLVNWIPKRYRNTSKILLENQLNYMKENNIDSSVNSHEKIYSSLINTFKELELLYRHENELYYILPVRKLYVFIESDIFHAVGQSVHICVASSSEEASEIILNNLNYKYTDSNMGLLKIKGNINEYDLTVGYKKK